MTRTEISNQVFKPNLIKAKMDEALSYLRRLGFAYCVTKQSNGPPVERWFLYTKDKEAEEYD